MAKKKRIVWEHQDFPFTTVDEELNTVDNKFTIVPFDKEEDGEVAEGEEIDIPIIMQTPLGMFAVDDRLNPYKNYEVRTGDTNFELTPNICRIIENEDGVEIFKRLGRYKFAIAIGKLFDFSEVRRLIEQKVCNLTDEEFMLSLIYDDIVKQNVSRIMDTLKDKKHFIYMFPNGNIEYSSENDENFIERILDLKSCQTLSGGLSFTNIME
jgi:hypothetical protein